MKNIKYYFYDSWISVSIGPTLHHKYFAIHLGLKFVLLTESFHWESSTHKWPPVTPPLPVYSIFTLCSFITGPNFTTQLPPILKFPMHPSRKLSHGVLLLHHIIYVNFKHYSVIFGGRKFLQTIFKSRSHDGTAHTLRSKLCYSLKPPQGDLKFPTTNKTMK